MRKCYFGVFPSLRYSKDKAGDVLKDPRLDQMEELGNKLTQGASVRSLVWSLRYKETLSRRIRAALVEMHLVAQYLFHSNGDIS